jgi:hypothetical protein
LCVLSLNSNHAGLFLVDDLTGDWGRAGMSIEVAL